jgi:hypothetical protein
MFWPGAKYDRLTDLHVTNATKYRIAAMPQVKLFPIVLLLMTAGCAGSMGVMHTDTSAGPVTAFDGSYRTTIQLTSTGVATTGTDWCQTSGQPIITIAAGQFSYALPHPNIPGNPTPTFLATLAKDGGFIGQGNDGTILGLASGTHIEGNISGAACGYSFAGDRL